MNYPYVGFFRRAGAFLIDSFIISILPTVLCIPLFSIPYAALLQLPDTADKYDTVAALLISCSLLWQVLFLIIYWLYFAFCESSRKQATWGKRLLGIKVIDQYGRRIRFGRATARAVARLFMPMTCYIGFVMAGCTRRKRALHDMIVQTYVVRKDFKDSDELPDTPGHPVWLIIWSVLLVGFTLLSIAVNAIANIAAEEIAIPAQTLAPVSSTPAPEVAAPQVSDPIAQAKTYLEELARTQAAVPTGVQTDGNRYFRHADGYRALLPNSITLFVPNGQTQACCEEDNDNSCQQAGLTPCSK